MQPENIIALLEAAKNLWMAHMTSPCAETDILAKMAEELTSLALSEIRHSSEP